MFDFIRNHTRLTLGFLLLLIIPSFVFFGVQGYSQFTDGSNTTVAQVGGRSITRAEWDQAHQRNVDRLRRERPEVDASLLDAPQWRRQTLDGLVREHVLLAAANDLHLAPNDARLQRLFVTDPQFAAMRNPDGSVNREVLAAQGLDSQTLVQQLRQDFAMQQVLAGVLRSALATPAIADAALDPLLQRREVQLQRFDPASYRAKAEPSDAEVQAYYDQNQAQFQAPEQARIEYAVLDLEQLASALAPTDDELRQAYADNAARYTAPEERRVSHILIAADKDAPSAERQQARAKAAELLAQARAEPGRFAELARQHSQDPGSAAEGGDLGWFGRGAMVKPFEQAAFALQTGQISDVVETDFGYHVLQLTGQRGGQKRPFEEVRGEVAAELRSTLAQKRWPELAEQFTNIVYEQSDSLQPALDKLKIERRTATVQRTPAAGAQGPLASSRFLDALFAADALTHKRNTDAIEFGPNKLVAGRVVEHTPARPLPLAEVRARVRDALVAERAAALAREAGEQRVAALRQAPEQALPVEATVSRAQPAGLPNAVVDAVLKADATKLPAAIGVDLGSDGYVVVKVTQVLPRDPAQGSPEALRAQYAQAFAAAEAAAYLQALNKRYKVEVKPAADVPADTPGAPLR